MLTEKTKNFIELVAMNLQEQINMSSPNQYSGDDIVDFVKMMGCKVVFNNEADLFSAKNGQNIIYLSYSESDIKANDNDILKILFHEIWHFLSCSVSSISYSSKYNGNSVNPIEAEANYFTRAMLLPNKDFVQSVIDNIDDTGMCNIFSVAQKFNVSYMDVIARGNDLSLWNKKGEV